MGSRTGLRVWGAGVAVGREGKYVGLSDRASRLGSWRCCRFVFGTDVVFLCSCAMSADTYERCDCRSFFCNCRSLIPCPQFLEDVVYNHVRGISGLWKGIGRASVWRLCCREPWPGLRKSGGRLRVRHSSTLRHHDAGGHLTAVIL